MKLFFSILVLILVIFSTTSFAEGLLLRGDLDPREVVLPPGYKLWSDLRAEEIKSRPMREEVMSSSSLFLENRISTADFLQFLKDWADLGFNQQERIVLTDTIQKSSMSTAQKNQWLCRIDNSRNCLKIKIVPKHLSPILQKYDWLVVDGQIFPRSSWDEISITDENLSWIFLSARFETYNFKGKWEDLKLKSPVLNDWITGNCDNFNVQSQVQALDINVMINRNCLKTSLPPVKRDPTFYEANKAKIWAAVATVIGISTFNSLAGKKIILEKPSFK